MKRNEKEKKKGREKKRRKVKQEHFEVVSEK